MHTALFFSLSRRQQPIISNDERSINMLNILFVLQEIVWLWVFFSRRTGHYYSKLY